MPLFLPGPGPLLNPAPEAGRASIDRASPTPARSFNGSGDYIEAGAPSLTGALTMAAMLRRTRSGAADWVLAHAGGLVLRFNASDGAQYFDGTTSRNANTLTVTEVDGWVILVATKAAGTTIPRFHLFKSGAWTHANVTGGTNVDAPAGAVVRFSATLTVTTYPLDLAVAAEWTSELSDAQIETLTTNRATADWTALTPQALWEFDQTTTAPPPDLMGGYHATTVTGTTAITTGPVPWTYDAATTTVVTLGSAAAVSAATLQVSAIVPLGAAAAQSAATLDLTAPSAGGPAIVPLETAAATSSATLALTAPAITTLATAAATSSATLALTAPAKVVLATAAATSSATLALTAPTKVVLATAAATSAATLALTAAAKLTLATAAATSAATLALTAPAKLTLGQADAVSAATLVVYAPSGADVPMGAAVAVSTATLTLTAAGQVVLGSSIAVSSATLTLVAKTTIVLGPAGATSTATLDLYVPGAPSTGLRMPVLMLILDDDD